MESSLNQKFNEWMTGNDSVVGVMAVDKQGFCCSAQGSLTAEHSGMVSKISKLAAMIEPNATDRPTIVLEGTAGNLTTIIQPEKNVDICIQKRINS